VLRQLHWLPVLQRVDFKVATLVHRSLSGISPSYLADDCRLVADARERRLRSTANWTCVVTRTYIIVGDRAFAAAGPGLWNSLPLAPERGRLIVRRFSRSLKTFSFGWWAHGAVWTILIAPFRNNLSYLLTYLLRSLLTQMTCVTYRHVPEDVGTCINQPSSPSITLDSFIKLSYILRTLLRVASVELLSFRASSSSWDPT